jgi:arylsulfatase A-like enzyme
MGEHGWFDKRFMYEESFRTPLLMRLPGGIKGDVSELVQNIDYAPTMLELAGVEVPSDIHGESLLPLLKGEEWPADRNALYYHYYEFPDEHSVHPHYGVRTERYKLMYFYDDLDSWELYDLDNDKKELNNIYGTPGTEALTDSLKQMLKELQVKYGEEEYIAQ